MALWLMNRLRPNGSKANGTRAGDGRKATVNINVARATKQIIYKICGHKGGMP